MSLVRVRTASFCATLGLVSSAGIVSAAQEPTQHQHQMPADDSKWMLMQDGVVYGLFNHQGGPRGGDEFRVPNWWMGMATRTAGRSRLTFTSMLSLDPATVGKRGYREIFQVGEAVDGRPLVDRQHPHDFLMQLAAVWRVALSDRTGFTVAGGPAGEPALGPVAFMHRASAGENPIAPLGHHIFDSTHIAFGVITAAVDHGPIVVEGSLFNGREPDEHRWDLDLGALDSVSARLWYKPLPAWELQVSTGHLTDPEELEPGNVQRTTASVGWTTREGRNMRAVTIGYGINASSHGRRQALLVEAMRGTGATATFGRFELLQVETGRLLEEADRVGAKNTPVAAITGGIVRDVLAWRGVDGAAGADLTFYAVPAALRNTHGTHPVTFQVFFRLRPPAGSMGRMWNMRMSQPGGQ